MLLLVLALQEQQAKQLALISAGIGKMLKGQQKFEERVAKELSGKQIKGEGEALGHVATYSNHPANGAPQKLSKSVTRNSNQFSDQSLSKVGFWAEPVVQPWFRVARFDNIEINPPKNQGKKKKNSTSKTFDKGVIILKDEQNLTFLQFSCLEIIIIINHH
jgi:hypothetical protein